ncbi:uncharacterized protein ttll10 [Diretmus argenteus]
MVWSLRPSAESPDTQPGPPLSPPMGPTVPRRSGSVLEVMSSESWVEPRRQGQTEERTTPKEEEEKEFPHGDNGLREDLRREESAGEDPSSLTLGFSTQEVTSEGGLEQEQVQEEGEEEVQRSPQEETKAQRNVNQRTESQDGGSGLCLEEQRRSCPRGRSDRSYPDRDRAQQPEEPRGPGPFYFFGGSNGATIVSDYCESRGWKRIYTKHREDFRLKWCETKSPANYYNFREGEQLLYQIPNNKVLTTKIGLLCSLRQHERVRSKSSRGPGPRRLKMEEFIPATFRMDMREEREAFFTQQEGLSKEQNPMWICKPTGLNQGRGIFLLKSREDVSSLRLKLQEEQEEGQASRRSGSRQPQDVQASRRSASRQPQARIVQRYIQNPLLLKGRKFDVRSYLLIACTAPYMVFFRHGYVRLTCDLYDPGTNNLSAHLTNQYLQKKNPLYGLLKEDTVWSMERFNAYVNEMCRVAKGLPRDWVMGVFAKRMQQIMTQCFFAVKSKLERRLGLFDLIGCDFMIDEEFKVWLLEMNCNPALHTNCEVLKEVVPSAVVETLDLTLEIFNKCRGGQRILPLANQREFVLLYSDAPASVPSCSKTRPAGSTLKTRSRPKTTQKTDRATCKSGKKGKLASATSSDTSVISARPSTVSTSSLRHSSPTNQHLPMQKCHTTMAPKHHLTPDPVDTLRPHPHPPKSSQPQVELKLSTCTRRHHPKKKNVASMSVSALIEGTPISTSRLRATKSGPKSDLIHSLHHSPHHMGRPLWVETRAKGEETSVQEPGGDTSCSALERKEEL